MSLQDQELLWLIQLRESRVPVGSAHPEMAEENEELPADEELPAPAEEGFEQLENDSPAERSGHVAVTDGRCMYVWGGYKVQLLGHPPRWEPCHIHPSMALGEFYSSPATPASNLYHGVLQR